MHVTCIGFANTITTTAIMFSIADAAAARSNASKVRVVYTAAAICYMQFWSFAACLPAVVLDACYKMPVEI